MTKRILTSLGQSDPLGVPLPHGTEVTTRVERVLNGKRVPQGVIGRVVRARDGGFDVLIIGLGELWYERRELAPRKAGQLEYAQRRADAWESLLPCTVLTATVGSRAWGLADEGSDTDVRGAFALPFLWTQGLVVPPTDLVSADGSQTFWETRKLVLQSLRADPNSLELLFVSTVKPTDVIGEWLLEARDAFVSKLIFGSFGRYALSQLSKLNASHRLAEHRDLLLDWLAEEPAPSLDEVAQRLARIAPRSQADETNAVLQAKTYIKQLYRSLSDQGLIERNDFEAMKAYARSGGRRPPEARELRPKNAYNLLRLIELATGWLRDGVPTFAPEGAFRERLMQIKRGQVPLGEVLDEAEAAAPRLEEARNVSALPEQPDYVRADALLKQIGEEIARRHIQRVPGVFGAAAPTPSRPKENDDDLSGPSDAD